MAKGLRRTSGKPGVAKKGSAARVKPTTYLQFNAAQDRITAVLARAKDSGLTSSKGGRIAGRVSPELIERAKARTGLQSDTELVEFALANIAVEDDFARVFHDLKGTVDPDLDLSF